ncbi:hypothetical protein PENANT_c002G10438 [Penicillium antarcticum]|uniref:FFD box profile domain-containing protein n=1 Tax=Penicillium antarcticum TaxID=416450 RepID=A0A1V6QKP9_9EURO|nr:uncharacterized protein N7508_006542 [Penicillium antarcticum]KAJ5301679.1 hypothetical protein N7508_006542 [Penicillium antarcticum]OQD89446.1 hypothetical protein PENANT_c002G10438 [Penicillium antarcticum]
MEMNHLIGQRFNLISKSDIRYVGTLHEINPEASTIALENVMSFGSEGRRGNPAEEVPPSTSVYEYIVFRGSDVKDISIASEEQKEAPQPEAPRVPDDPAILGGMQRPVPSQAPESGPQSVPQGPPQPPQGAGQTPPGYPQQPQFQQGFYPPYGQRFGPPPPFPPGPGFPPYGAPPGWYPPPGHGFPPGPGQFAPPMPMAPGQQPGPQRPGPPGVAPGPKPTSELPAGDKVPSKSNSRNATPAAQNAPPPPVESKPSVAEVQASVGSAPAPIPHKSGRVMPAIPIAAPKAAPRANNQPITDATAAATAAVAAAMAKLPQPGVQKQPDAPVDTLTQQMNNMRPYDGARGGRGGHQHHQHQNQHQPRGGRGGARHHNQHQQHKKIEVPQSDYDFETANAKFNKQDLVKEAIATGVPAAEAEAHAEEVESQDAANHVATSSNNMYSRSSFFDNISSEARDREENTARVGGREWRGEEEKRNMETFGQGSVDGYRPNYRGRGRGRGYGRGRGGYGRGYGRGRGGRTQSESTGVPSQG